MNTYVLWTGGWDSTFRMVQLSVDGKANDTIQAIYVAGDDRKSEKREIQAMNEIIGLLRGISCSTINDIIIIDKARIKENATITDAYYYMRSIVPLGSQYEFLSRLAVEYPGIELGIERPNGEFGGCTEAINKTGSLLKKNGSYYIDTDNSSEECNALFGNFSFPLTDLTELDMVEWIEERGLSYIMKHIWFCHNPINGEPCGICRPCQQKMECNMNWLLPKDAQARYRKYAVIKRVFGEKIGRRIGNTLIR